jgi:hypothetical protein
MIVTQTYCDQNTAKDINCLHTNLTIDMHPVHGIIRIFQLQPPAL